MFIPEPIDINDPNAHKIVHESTDIIQRVEIQCDLESSNPDVWVNIVDEPTILK